MGKSSINGPFSMAMLNNQRVYMSLKMLGELARKKEKTLFQTSVSPWHGDSLEVFSAFRIQAEKKKSQFTNLASGTRNGGESSQVRWCDHLPFETSKIPPLRSWGSLKIPNPIPFGFPKRWVSTLNKPGSWENLHWHWHPHGERIERHTTPDGRR